MSEQRVLPLSDEYRRPIRVALYQQAVVAILCLLMLDGGQLAKLFGLVMIGFWTGAALIMFRRPVNPTEVDKLLIKYGFVPLFVAAMELVPLLQW
jgi:hypothetical protein